MNHLENSGLRPSSPDQLYTPATIEKLHDKYIRHINQSIIYGDSDSAHDFFMVMIHHINKLKKRGVTEEEMGISLRELSLRQARFHKKMMLKLIGRGGQANERERLNDCLKIGGLTEADLEEAEVEENKTT